MKATTELGQLLRAFEDAVERGADQTRVFLASPAGRRIRSLTAGGILLATPMILRHPFFKTPLGRAIEIGGAAALISRAASLIRDWEPAPEAATVAVPGPADRTRSAS
ncbi:MAG TPA: hypothetical protein VFP13_11065 [Actinomycetota bacterium]|nr:hypothetical protein [Actinomycetota bacterium]